jgi:uncharacterized membrane protein
MAFCQSCAASIPEGSTQCENCVARSAATSVTYPPAAPASSGLSVNAAAALAYLAGVVTGIIFLVVEPYKNDRFVRFHAFQCIFFNIAWIGVWIAWVMLGFLLGAVTKGLFFLLAVPINLLLMFGGLVLWLWLMYSAYQGKTFKLPIIGALAAKQAGL